jgi:Dit-like phage tail protein
MAFENLLIRKQNSIGIGDNIVILDALVKETIQTKLQVTTHPVELGANITDHAIIQPKKYTLEGVVTDTPRLQDRLSRSIVDPVTSLFGSTTTKSSTRSLSAYKTLVRLQDSREPFDISTGYDIIRNVLIESLDSSRDKDTSRALFFTATLIQINIVETQITAVTPDQVFDKEENKILAGGGVAGAAETGADSPSSIGQMIKNIFNFRGATDLKKIIDAFTGVKNTQQMNEITSVKF